jgi:hypothetical protein
MVLRRSAGSPSKNTAAKYIHNGAEYWRKIALAAVPKACAEMNVMFMSAKHTAMTIMSGRNEMSARRNIVSSTNPANRAR